MASSLNGLTVGDNITENLMESPLRSDCVCYPRYDFQEQLRGFSNSVLTTVKHAFVIVRMR